MAGVSLFAQTMCNYCAQLHGCAFPLPWQEVLHEELFMTCRDHIYSRRTTKADVLVHVMTSNGQSERPYETADKSAW